MIKHDNRSLSDIITKKVRDEIISGVMPSGSPLVETHIAARYGVSRNTVRESIQQLILEGLLVYVRNRGVRVKLLNIDDVRDIYKIRCVMELHAIECSATSSMEDINHIEQALLEQRKYADQGQWRDVGTWSLHFHQYIVKLLKSNRFDQFYEIITAQLRTVFSLSDNEKDFQSRWIDKDTAIFNAMHAGRRKEANLLMNAYLEESEKMVLDIVRLAHYQVRTSKHKY